MDLSPYTNAGAMSPQTVACRRVLAAVIGQALMDSTIQPITDRRGRATEIHPDACSALRFLLGDGVEGYAEFLGIDPGQIRVALRRGTFIAALPGNVETKNARVRSFRMNLKMLDRMGQVHSLTVGEDQDHELASDTDTFRPSG